MQLLTHTVLSRIPPLSSQDATPDPMVVCKFFTPDAQWTWYVIEGSTREREGCGFGQNCHHKPLSQYDPTTDDVLFFGYVEGIANELGYFSLSELVGIRGALGLPIERDRHFTPRPLSRIQRES